MKYLYLTLLCALPLSASLRVGVFQEEITPPVGTPSAGYADRKGDGMEGVHDPLLAVSLFIDDGEKRLAFCSVDHLGFTHDMALAIREKVRKVADVEVYIGSSHTHSGGGAFLNIPMIGEMLAGKYDPVITAYYVDQTAKAILRSIEGATSAKIGFGYGSVEGISKYRGMLPVGIIPEQTITLIKATTVDDEPLALLFNYPLHPTVLNGKNRLFSADFVGYARESIAKEIGVKSIYFNGAQGDIIPSNQGSTFEEAERIGEILAHRVASLWQEIETKDHLKIKTEHLPYSFEPKPTPYGVALPIREYHTELNLVVFDDKHAFVTIPGELSTNYDKNFQQVAKEIGYNHLSILGLVNDAHGYIILPESYRAKTMESYLSFGGEGYGPFIQSEVTHLLEKASID